MAADNIVKQSIRALHKRGIPVTPDSIARYLHLYVVKRTADSALAELNSIL